MTNEKVEGNDRVTFSKVAVEKINSTEELLKVGEEARVAFGAFENLAPEILRGVLFNCRILARKTGDLMALAADAQVCRFAGYDCKEAGCVETAFGEHESAGHYLTENALEISVDIANLWKEICDSVHLLQTMILAPPIIVEGVTDDPKEPAAQVLVEPMKAAGTAATMAHARAIAAMKQAAAAKDLSMMIRAILKPPTQPDPAADMIIRRMNQESPFDAEFPLS